MKEIARKIIKIINNDVVIDLPLSWECGSAMCGRMQWI
jgi:hypothetical protein